jgi:TPR repeat protein
MSTTNISKDQWIIRALLAAGDRHYVLVRNYLQAAGFSLPANGEAARAWSEERAERGDAEAQFVCAKLATVGLYGPEDKRAGLHWCEKAVEQGSLPAMLLLAGYHADGWGGLDADKARSLALIQDAAARGYAPADCMLGTLYAEGVDVPKSDAQAIACYRKAADAGDARAQFFLGTSLLKSGATATEAEGIDWLTRAAQQDDASAHSVLAKFYMAGSHGLAKDPTLAKFHHERSAQLEGFES